MADPITERTAELEQGLKDFQSTVEARTDAPPLPLTQPAAEPTVDPNSAYTPQINQVSVPPAQQPAQPDEDHPTWDQIEATPEYKSASPTEKLLTFSRWHDATYNMLQDHPDWASVKDDFNNNAAKKEQELSKEAGGVTPDQARAEIAKQAVKDAGATTPQAERDVLKSLGPDFARSYLNDKLGVQDVVLPDEKLIAQAMANGMNRQQAIDYVNKDLESKPTATQEFGAHILLRNSSMLNNSMAAGAKLVAPLLNESGQRTMTDAANYFQHAADITDAAFTQKTGGIIDPNNNDSVPNMVADTLGTMLATAPATAATMLVPEAAIPAAMTKIAKVMSIGARATGYMVKAGQISANMIPVGLEFAGDASNKAYSEAIAKDPKDIAGAEKAATAAALTSLKALPAYALGGSAAGAVEGKLLPQILNPWVRGGTRFITGTAGNILATEGLKLVEGKPLGLTKEDIVSSATFAGHPAVEAAHSEAKAAANVPLAQSIMKGTDARLQVFDKLAQEPSLTDQQRQVAANSAAAMRKDAADFLASRKIEPEKPDVVTKVQQQAADNATKGGAPQVGQALNDIAQAPDEAVVKAAEKGAAKPAKEAAAPAGAEVTLGFDIDASGDRTPKVEIPDGATVKDLQDAKKEVDKSYPKDSAEANEFHRQLDAAIEEKNKEFAPAPKSIIEGPGAGGERILQPGVRGFLQRVKEIKEGPGTEAEKADKIHEESMNFTTQAQPENVTRMPSEEKQAVGVRLNDQNMIEGPAMDLHRVKELQDEVKRTGKLPSDKILNEVVGPEMIDGFKKWASQHIKATNVIPFTPRASATAEGFERLAEPETMHQLEFGPSHVIEKERPADQKVINGVTYTKGADGIYVKGTKGPKRVDITDKRPSERDQIAIRMMLSALKAGRDVSAVYQAFKENTQKSDNPLVRDLQFRSRDADSPEKAYEALKAKLAENDVKVNEVPVPRQSPAEYSPEENKLGRYDLPKSGIIPVKDFKIKGSAGGQLSDDEIALYRQLVPDAFTNQTVMASPKRVGRTKVPSTEVSYAHELVNVPKLIQGLKDHGPVVEVHTIGEGDESEHNTPPLPPELQRQVQERDQLRHEWLDNLAPSVAEAARAYAFDVHDAGYNSETALRSLDHAVEVWAEYENEGTGVTEEEKDDFVADARHYAQLNDLVLDGIDDHEDANDFTDYKFVAPKAAENMPEYQVRLIRLPLDYAEMGGQKFPITDNLKFRGHHFGQHDTNVVAFSRGYLETLPNGEKAWHVIEVQSDWAAKAAQLKEDLQTGKVRLAADHFDANKGQPSFAVGKSVISWDRLVRHGWKDKGLIGDKLLDSVTEFVRSHADEISKASKNAPPHPILHAYETMALKDAIARAKELGAKHVVISDSATAMMTEGHDKTASVQIVFKDDAARQQFIHSSTRGRYAAQEEVDGKPAVTLYEPHSEDAKEVYSKFGKVTLKGPPQEKGMELHYDKTLPAAMDKLVGEQSKDVDLGEHKTAHAEGYTDAAGHQLPPGSPYFREQGQPKANVTGRMWDISKLGPDPIPLVELPKEKAPDESTRYNEEQTYHEEVQPDEVAARQKANEQHKKVIAERNPVPNTPVAKEAVEAIKNGNLKDITYDGRGMVGEQFTELDPHSPSHGATFEVPTNASLHDLLEKRIEVRDKFAGTEEAPRGSATEPRELDKAEMSALNKRAYADAQEMKRKSGRGQEFDVTAAYNARRAELLKEARSKPAPEVPKAGEGATRAERSAANKAAHRAKQQAASAARKEARAKAPGMAEAKAQITADSVKNGIVPSVEAIQDAHPDMDITSAQDLRMNLQKELRRVYPPEDVPKGAKVTTIEHDYTKEGLPMIEEKGEDGVTRTRPMFSNDPDITAQQKDQGLFSDDEGNRLYIPDELEQNEKVNPAIGDHMKWDPEAKQYYVSGVDTALGHVELSHEEALGQQEAAASRKEGEAPKEQENSYTQLRQEQDAFGKGHAHLYVGEKLEAVNEEVQKHLRDRGIPDDAVNFDFNRDPLYEAEGEGSRESNTEILTEREANAYINKLSQKVSDNITKEMTDQADDLGLIRHEGMPKVNMNDVLNRIANDFNSPPFMRDVAKLIQKSGFDLSHINPLIVYNSAERYGGRYWHHNNTMEFNLAGGRHLGGVRTTFMHELIHGILDAKLEPDAKRNPAEQKAYEALNAMHDTLSRMLFERSKGRLPDSQKELEAWQDAQYGNFSHPDNLGRDYYGLSNLHEFTTEALTNPRFDAIIHEVLGPQTTGVKKSFFGNIIENFRRSVMALIGGREVTPTSALYQSLDHMLNLIKEGPAQQTVNQIVMERARREAEKGAIKFMGSDEAVQELKKAFDEANKGKKFNPDLNKIKDKQGLNRAERSQINKLAYKLAQEEAKKQGKGFDVMKEYERQRDELLARARQEPATFTAEGKAKMQELRARQAEEAVAEKGDTGMTQADLDAEIAGEEEPLAGEEPELTGEPLPPKINLYDKVRGNGWVTPEGKFLPVEERYHQGLTAGVNPLVFGGHGSHGSAAWEYIQSQPKLKAEFDQAAQDKGYSSVLEMTEGDVKDFLQDRGFLRVLHEGHNTYFSGKRTVNPAGEKMLMRHAQDNGRILTHDRETGDTRNSLKELYRPAHLQGQKDALGFFEPRGSATEPEKEEKDVEEQAKIKYQQRANGKRTISIEGVPNKAQVEALSKQIDEDTGSSAVTKSALKDQLAISAKAQEPTLVDRFQVKNPLTGKTLRLKDSGKEIVVAGANSANNIPRIMAEQGANRVAQDYGSVKKPTKEIMLDRSAATLIIDHGKDLQRLEEGRDQVANGAESGKKYLPVYDHAIENFKRLQGKEAHTQAMKDIADREHSYGIPTPLLEDYVTRILKSPDVSDNDMFAVPDGAGGVRYFTKARSFETLSDALSAGFTPKTLDIVELDAHRIEAGERLIQQKIYHESLRSVLAPDGKPIVGTQEPRATLYHGEEMAVPKGYRLVDVPGGAPLVVHEDYVPLFKAIYGDGHRNALNKWAGFMKRNTLVLDTFHVGRIMFKEAAFSKGVGRFGYGKGLSILEYTKQDLNKALELGDINKEQHQYAMEHYEDAQALIRSGLNVAKISDNMDAELTKYLAPYLNGFNSWVFKKLSRGAMLQTALANLERNQARFGKELSREEVLRRTSKETNEIFGNLQMQSVFKSPQTQNMLRSLLLAPQWAESQLTQEFRGYGQLLRAPIDLLQGKARIGVVAQGQITAVIGTFMAMQIMSLAMNGHSTFQNKKGDWFALHIPQIGGRGEFEFNPLEIGSEYAFMAYRYRSQHMEPLDIAQRILFNKLNPVAHGAVNTLLNRDYQGKRFANSLDRTKAALESLVPLPPLAGAAVERDPRQLTGFRFTRQPAAWEKTLFQSAGFKLSNAQTPRGEMFALAHRFRSDKNYGDNSPPVYRDLRQALDNRNEGAVKSEIELLAARGATEEQIKKAVGITHGGIQPEKFSGKADTERLFVRALTPDQRKVYNEAQADHKTNANLLRSVLSQMKLKDSELVKLLHKNAKKPTIADFEQ